MSSSKFSPYSQRRETGNLVYQGLNHKTYKAYIAYMLYICCCILPTNYINPISSPSVYNKNIDIISNVSLGLYFQATIQTSVHYRCVMRSGNYFMVNPLAFSGGFLHLRILTFNNHLVVLVGCPFSAQQQTQARRKIKGDSAENLVAYELIEIVSIAF